MAGGKFRLEIDGSGEVNGTGFTAEGRGGADAESGRFWFDVDFSAVPPGADPFANLLAIFIIPTGIFGQEMENATNLLRLAGGELDFTQSLSADGVATRSSGRIQRVDDETFRWTSTVEGRVELRNVTAIEPCEAVMVPGGAGKIVETIELPLFEGERRLVVHAARTFTFTPRSDLPDLQLRFIDIEPRVSGNTVGVTITSAIWPFHARARSPEPRTPRRVATSSQ
jgi:hypothetical protein